MQSIIHGIAKEFKNAVLFTFAQSFSKLFSCKVILLQITLATCKRHSGTFSGSFIDQLCEKQLSLGMETYSIIVA